MVLFSLLCCQPALLPAATQVLELGHRSCGEAGGLLERTSPSVLGTRPAQGSSQLPNLQSLWQWLFQGGNHLFPKAPQGNALSHFPGTHNTV